MSILSLGSPIAGGVSLAMAALLTLPAWDGSARSSSPSPVVVGPYGALPHYRFGDQSVPMSRGALQFALRWISEYRKGAERNQIAQPSESIAPSGYERLPEGCEALGSYGTELGRMAGRCIL
jgi:hypothetical protein